MSKFLELFKQEKPIIGMLHLGRRYNISDALELTKKEIDIYLENGVDGLIVEDYFGDYNEVFQTLEYLQTYKDDTVYGVNYLRNYQVALELTKFFNAKFVQIDSVCGHLIPEEDIKYAQALNELRESYNIPIIGGVRFKYQPYLSGRALEEDLALGMERCDGIVVTGLGTGKETPLEKVQEFRQIVKDFPLIIGAGLTPDNCIPSLLNADAAIVGSYFKYNHKDENEVSKENVKRLVRTINTLRK